MSERVRVYRNLHKQCYSVQTYTPGVGWRVDHHADEISLIRAEFKISKRGQQRVREERKKNVHAFVYGVIDGDTTVPSTMHYQRLTYNPYDDFGFSAVPRSYWSPINIVEASHVILNEHGMFAWAPGIVGDQNRVRRKLDMINFTGYTTDHE